MSAWRSCRREIVRKLVPFANFSVPNQFLPSAPNDNFIPGNQSNNIRFERAVDSVRWTVNASADECIRGRLYSDGCLPFAADVILLRHYVATISCDLTRGRIAGAVAGVVEDFLNADVMDLLMKIERQSQAHQLTLNDIATKTRPLLYTAKQLLELLVVIVKQLQKDLCGGEILSEVSARLHSSVSQSAVTVLRRMERAALSQYYDLLSSWIRYGRLDQDFAHEFMVWDLHKTKMYSRSEVMRGKEEHNFMSAPDGFDDRYCVINELCPSQLASAASDIVKCGKYFNIIKRIKGAIYLFELFSNLFICSEEDVVNHIRQTRIEGSQRLVLLLRKQFHLDELFDSIRLFFLLEQSDWLITLIELCGDHLLRPLKGVTETDIDADRDSLNGADALSLAINLTFPLSLVFPHNFTLNLAIIFRYLFSLHRAIFTLYTKQRCDDLLGEERVMLEWMLHILNAILSHFTVHIIPALWSSFVNKISKVIRYFPY
ncbi:unnamed protein product [Anisakis simplex]|uniref:Gamma-tubulin complex component n=1 Tax=Anisakis simplex TaxID=6269 RepID=A0A0M3K6P4_ANISI|nr:unnamed protein product [Anisakis simplex]